MDAHINQRRMQFRLTNERIRAVFIVMMLVAIVFWGAGCSKESPSPVQEPEDPITLFERLQQSVRQNDLEQFLGCFVGVPDEGVELLKTEFEASRAMFELDQATRERFGDRKVESTLMALSDAELTPGFELVSLEALSFDIANGEATATGPGLYRTGEQLLWKDGKWRAKTPRKILFHELKTGEAELGIKLRSAAAKVFDEIKSRALHEDVDLRQLESHMKRRLGQEAWSHVEEWYDEAGDGPGVPVP